MNKLGSLIRVGIKSNFGFAVLRHRIFTEKRDRWFIPIILLSLAGIFPAIYGLVLFIHDIFAVLKPMGQERALLAVSIAAGQLTVIIFGIYYVVSAFYFSRDIETLVPLPLRPFHVIFSKFVVILINEYLTVAIVILPFFITFGYLAKANAGYWLNAAIVYLFLPVIPLTIVSILVVFMMRWINLSRKKDLFIMLGSVALIVLSLGIQLVAQRAGKSEIGPQEVAALLASPDSLLNSVGRIFPPSIWATKAIAGGFSGSGLLNLAVFIGSSLVCFCALTVLSEKLFYKGLIGISETGIRRKALTQNELARRISSGRSGVAAVFIREWRIMNRTPVFLLNGIMVAILVPAMLVIMSQSGSFPFARFLMKTAEKGDGLSAVLIMALLMTICGCFNSTAPSTFSREGLQFWISQVIPVPPREQIAAKFLHSYIINMLGIMVGLVILGAILRGNAGLMAAAVLLAILANAFLICIGMIIDLARPLLDWTNPQKAVKQNLNVMISFFAEAGILAACFWLYRIMTKHGWHGTAIYIAFFATFMLLGAASYLGLLKFADKRYREIEN